VVLSQAFANAIDLYKDHAVRFTEQYVRTYVSASRKQRGLSFVDLKKLPGARRRSGLIFFCACFSFIHDLASKHILK
jgi:hypothetical protein